MGIDATVPYGYESDFHRPVYGVDLVKPENFFNEKDIDKIRMKKAAEWDASFKGWAGATPERFCHRTLVKTLSRLLDSP